jgi:hypothetical protein
MNLIHEKSKEEYAMIEVRPEGSIDILGSNTTLNRWDMLSKFGYTKISKIYAALGGRFACPFCLSGGGATLLDKTNSIRRGT